MKHSFYIKYNVSMSDTKDFQTEFIMQIIPTLVHDMKTHSLPSSNGQICLDA